MKLFRTAAVAAVLAAAALAPAYAAAPNSSIAAKDANAAAVTLGATSDGTLKSPTHGLIDSTGNVLDPATSTLQTSANTKLDTINTSVGTLATAAAQTTGNGSLASLVTNTTGLATAANQSTAASTLSTIATNTTGASTSALQTTMNTKLDTLHSDLGTSGTLHADFGTNNTNLTTLHTDLGTSGTLHADLAVLSNNGAVTNPSSTLTLTATTTAYAAGQAVASSATAGSIVVPSFAVANSAGGFLQARGRLYINDATSTAWGGVLVQVDEWSAAPTYSTGDRTTVSYATGSASHLASFSCTMSSVTGDGVYGECAPIVGTTPAVKLASGTSVFWTVATIGATGVTGASKVVTWVPELSN